MRKNTELSVNERRDKILELISKGITSRGAINKIIGEQFDVSVSQIDKDVYIVKDLIKKEYIAEREQEISEAVFRLKNLIYKNMSIMDYKEARQAQKDLSDLLGLAAPTKIAQTDTEGKDIPIEAPIIFEDLVNAIKDNRVKSRGRKRG